jgi:hypothetical protein
MMSGGGGGGLYNTASDNFFKGREQPTSAMTIQHPGSGEGLFPAVGDYISEDFLQVLEVSSTYTHNRSVL